MPNGRASAIPAFRRPRDARPISAGSVADRFPELVEARAKLDAVRIAHLDLTKRVLEADGGRMYWPDFLIGAILQRSYGLVDAVIDCVDAYNIAAAAPLLRMQLDTLVRACYVAYADLSDDIVKALFKGSEFRKIKDKDGKQLSDARLNELAHPHHPWVKEVYKETSGWVHLSPHHLRSSWQFEGDAFSGGVPLRPDVIPAKLWLELLTAMTQATEEIFDYVLGWASQKGLPPGQTRSWPAPYAEPSSE